MKIIGITGGIGTGKSKVLDILQKYDNTYIIEADKVAHLIMSKNFSDAFSIYNKLIQLFGNEIIDSTSGEIDRKILGNIVMKDEKLLEQLNALVHPEVKRYILADIEKHKLSGTKYYVIEAALLIQDGYKSICDEIWFIRTDVDTRIKRLRSSRNYSYDKAVSFIKNQPEDEYFIKGSDRIIDNNSDEAALTEQIYDCLMKIE